MIIKIIFGILSFLLGILCGYGLMRFSKALYQREESTLRDVYGYLTGVVLVIACSIMYTHDMLPAQKSAEAFLLGIFCLLGFYWVREAGTADSNTLQKDENTDRTSQEK